MGSPDTGAAAALNRWAAQEQREALAVQDAAKTLDKLMRLDRDDTEIKTKISFAEHALDSAKDQWAKTSNILLKFDKGVSPERREGEKIQRAEAEDIAEMLVSTLRMANEQHIVNLCQDLERCQTREERYKLSADSFRGCFTNAVQSVADEGKVPAWFKDAALRGL